MNIFQIAILFMLISFFFILVIFYLYKNRLYFYREAHSIMNGYNKLPVISKSSHQMKKDWEGKNCIYFRMKILSSKPGVHQETIFEEPNDIIFEFKNNFIQLPSNFITYNVKYALKKTLYIPDISERFHFFQIKDENQIKKYYLSDRYQPEGSKSSCFFSEFVIRENDNFYLYVFFNNKKIDKSKKIFLTEMNSEYQNKIFIVACIMSSPGIVLLIISILLMINN